MPARVAMLDELYGRVGAVIPLTVSSFLEITALRVGVVSV